MRQFFTWRWWLTIAALVGGALVLMAVLGRPGDESIAAVIEPPQRRVDLITVAKKVDPEVGWQVRSGVSRGTAKVRLDDGTTYLLADGTPGDDQCTRIEDPSGCVLLADTLGDAIIWFALLDAPAEGTELRLPPIEALLEGVTWARLDNGWELPLLSVVERRCGTKTLTLGNYVDVFGERSYTILDLEAKEISAVQCRRK